MRVREQHPCPVCGTVVKNVVREGRPYTYCSVKCRRRQNTILKNEFKRYKRRILREAREAGNA